MPKASSTHGRIITFYSYKGGTGRTMALANVAWIAASKGYRVLAVDWDLESPGLHRYFHPFLLDRQLRSSRGVIDMIRDFAAATLRSPSSDNDPLWLDQCAQVFQYAISLNWDFPDGGRLDLLLANPIPRWHLVIGAFAVVALLNPLRVDRVPDRFPSRTSHATPHLCSSSLR